MEHFLIDVASQTHMNPLLRDTKKNYLVGRVEYKKKYLKFWLRPKNLFVIAFKAQLELH